jgi:hypothetical protein
LPNVVIDEDRIDHIFREAEGHFPTDTTDNRRALIGTASRPGNFAGTDRFGNDWFSETRSDGTQIWVQVRESKITNGGVDMTPRNLDLANPADPPWSAS